MKNIIPRLQAFILAILILSSGTVYAESVKPEAVLNALVNGRRELKALKAVYRARTAADDIQSADNGRSTGSEPLPEIIKETVFFRSPDRLRLNLSRPDREEVFLASGMKSLVMVGDQATTSSWPQPILLYRLLLDTDARVLRDLLSAYGFELTQSVAETNHYILGDPVEASRGPRIRIDRKSSRLVGLRLPAIESAPEYDIQLDDYRTFDNMVDWPQTLIVRKGSDAPIILKLEDLQVNPQIVQEELDIEEIRKSLAQEPEAAPQTTNPDLIKIRKQMEWLEKKLQ